MLTHEGLDEGFAIVGFSTKPPFENKAVLDLEASQWFEYLNALRR